MILDRNGRLLGGAVVAGWDDIFGRTISELSRSLHDRTRALSLSLAVPNFMQNIYIFFNIFSVGVDSLPQFSLEYKSYVSSFKHKIDTSHKK